MEPLIHGGRGIWRLSPAEFAVADLTPPPKIRAVTRRMSAKQILTPCGLHINADAGVNYMRAQDPIRRMGAKSYGDRRSLGPITSTSRERLRPLPPPTRSWNPYINQGGFDAIVKNHHRQLQKTTTRPRRELRQTYAGWGKRDIADRRPSAQEITQFLDHQARINIPHGVEGPPPTRGIWHNEIRRISISNADAQPPTSGNPPPLLAPR